MTEIDPTQYRTAVHMAAQLRDNPSTDGDRALQLNVVLRTLAEHPPPAVEGAECPNPDDDETWPCSAVQSAMTDLEADAVG
ncbi:hypothetical protein [Actinomadura parmotrematis]|uniref:Uncharacterized protein n=1 Tax=Actinomadura parmotrematis TaxID=2864039 RepID=A0ABS7G471_9ACTN|nr:hypothetical protein [Actinomadura parmotrematis]MBW8487520.1 hypothetical protein [Actinomadura parmotrematis]